MSGFRNIFTLNALILSLFVLSTRLSLAAPTVAQSDPPPTPFASACITASQAPLPALTPESMPDTYSAIEAYLNAGGDLDALQSHLDEVEMLLQPQFEAMSLLGVWSADVDGDRVRDVVVNFTQPVPDQVDFASGQIPEIISAIVLYRCIDGQYEQVSAFELSTQPAITQNGLAAHFVKDLTGDGSAEIAYHTTSCGAHTCFQSVNVLTWNNDTLMDVLSEPISYPQGSYDMTDKDNDGSAELIITTGMIGSVGAGPQRSHTLTYDWNNGALILYSDEVTPPRFRFEVIEDAVRAHIRGMYDVAIMHYERALNDDNYEEFSLFQDRQEAATIILMSLSRFGIYSAAVAAPPSPDETREQQIEAAYNALLELPEQVDTDNDGETELNLWRYYGQRLHEELASGKTVAEACAVVAAEIRELAFPDSEFWSVPAYYPDLGYANEPPQPEDLCDDRF